MICTDPEYVHPVFHQTPKYIQESHPLNDYVATGVSISISKSHPPLLTYLLPTNGNSEQRRASIKQRTSDILPTIRHNIIVRERISPSILLHRMHKP
jgi:hypothetical protein